MRELFDGDPGSFPRSLDRGPIEAVKGSWYCTLSNELGRGMALKDLIDGITDGMKGVVGKRGPTASALPKPFLGVRVPWMRNAPLGAFYPCQGSHA